VFSRRGALMTFLLWAVLTPARAADWLLAMPDSRVVPGDAFEVVVVGEPVGAGWPRRLAASIELPGGGPRVSVDLTAAGAPVPAGQRYVGQWPGEIAGIVTLTLANAARARLLVDARVAPALPDAASGGEAAAQLSGETRASAVDHDLISPAEAGAEAVKPEALGFHEPMYFVAGGSAPKGARFQISFRYRLFDDQGVVAETLPVARGLYFGFTQTSLWDLESDSKPFRDTSFRPSLFYQWKISNPPLGDSLTLAGGYEHESNGRDGDDSRSIDTWFVRTNLRYHLPDGRTYIGIEPKLWSYIDKSDNSDIARYRGHGQLGLRIGRDSALMLAATLRRGTAGVGSTQIDLSYPLRRSIFSGVGAFVHLQYFNGYGQTLLEYAESRSPQIRLGISVVR
jgi:outer membrane phospholipase A